MEIKIYLLERKCLSAFKKLDILKAVMYDKQIKELKYGGQVKNENYCEQIAKNWR